MNSLDARERAEVTEVAVAQSESWPMVPLRSLCDSRTGVRNPSLLPEQPFQYVDISAVDNDRKRIVAAQRLIGTNAPSRARNVIRTRDVIVATTRPNLNAVALVPPELDDGICSTGFCVLRAGPRVLPEYLFAFVRSPAFIDPLSEMVKGALYPAVNDAQVLALEIPLPPLAEQERIAARLTEQLTAVERARAAAQSRLTAAEALPAAYLREVFGTETPLSAAPLLPTEPTRPGWRWCLLTDIARLATGHTPSRREPAWWGGDIHWLQLPDIRAVDGRRVIKTLEQTNSLGIANSSAVLLPAGTVCMSRTASVGFVTIMGREMATSQDFVNWVCGPDLDPDFLMYLILRCRREIRDLGSGATHHSIYFETVLNFAVCIPPMAEQRRIAAALAQSLAAAERLAEGIRAELAAIEAMPAALLREAFRGEEAVDG